MIGLEARDVRLAPLDPRLVGRAIDRPREGELSEGAGLPLVGWVLGRDVRAVAVELLEGERVIRRLPLDHPRPDLTKAFPDIADADQGGYRSALETVGMGEVELSLQAVLADQQRVPLATLHLARRWREETYHAAAPLVSVVITCYDQAGYLAEAIESVLAQTYPHLELVVVDDGSHDNTPEVATRYPGVRLVSQENSGLSGARNTGIRHTNGAYLVFLDADDRLLPNAVADGLTAFAEHPQAAFVAGRYRIIDAAGVPLETSTEPPPVSEDPYESFLRANFDWIPGCAMYRRALFELMGGFDRTVDESADYEFCLRVTRELPIRWHRQLIAEYREGEKTMSRDPARMLRAVTTTLRRHWPQVRQSPERREAYRLGMRAWMELYGEEMVDEVGTQLQRRDWPRVLRAITELGRLYPRGLTHLR